jgi:ferredoxin-NADP reductase
MAIRGKSSGSPVTETPLSGQAAAPPRLIWRQATVEHVAAETPTVKSFLLRVPEWPGFRAGQHVDVRLTAEDGYQAERSYSIGSAPESGLVELVIEKLADGEVSGFFHEVVQAGDAIELRGPIGGHFVWDAGEGGPILLVGGGSGVVPLMSMLRHRMSVAPEVPAALIYSVRHFHDVIFRDELFRRVDTDPNFRLWLTITREAAPAPARSGRVDARLVSDALAGFGGMTPKRMFVCGSNAFVDTAARLLLEMGLPFASIKTERYGGDPARDALAARTVAEG